MSGMVITHTGKWLFSGYNRLRCMKCSFEFEYRISLSEVLACAPCKPLLGNRRPTNSKTHWLVFFKETSDDR